MRHFKRNKLSLAIGVAAISLASLPALAVIPGTHAVDGVSGGSAASYTNGGSVHEVVVLKPMTSVKNRRSGTIFQNSHTSQAALTILSGASVVTLTNNGTIKNEQLSDSQNIALASYADLSGIIKNTSHGVISAVAIYDNSLTATALYFDGDITDTGSIINRGDIIASATLTSTAELAEAIGVYISGNMHGSLINDGNIIVTADNTYANAYGVGIHVVGNVTGAIENNGLIDITVTATDARASGIYIGGNISSTGSILNEGDINIDISATGSNVATGIYVGGSVAGDITNTGDITITDMTTAYSNYYYGIRVDGELTGSLTNDGDVIISADASYFISAEGIHVDSIGSTGKLINTGQIDINVWGPYAVATGIHVNGDMAGEILNSGDIAITDMTSGYSHTYYGISVDGELSGSLTNDGNIIISAEATDDIYAEGIHVGSIGSTGVLTNSGLIDITALNSDDVLQATGIHIAGNMAGSVSNTGQIRISATQQSSESSGVWAGGIWVEGSVSGTITNSGEITTTTISTSDYAGSAYGIYISGELTGSITNTSTGTITAHAMNDTNGSGSYATAYGIYVGTVGSTGRITNDGTITAKAINTYNDASAIGIYVGGDLNGGIVNNGDIIVEASASKSDVYAATGVYVSGNIGVDGYIHNTGTISVNVDDVASYNVGTGIFVGGDVDGEIINSSDITVTSMVHGYSSSNLYGIDIDGTLSGTLTNTSTGTISVSRSVETKETYVQGIDIDDLTGTLNNHGSIIVDAKGLSYIQATAVSISKVSEAGVINNTGDIIATASGSNSVGGATAVYVNVFYGTLNNSGTISASDNMNLSIGSDRALALYQNQDGFGPTQVNNLTGGLIHGDLYTTIHITVDNKGTIWLPSAHQGEIYGDYTQAANGTFRLSAMDDTTYGSLLLGNTATFAPDTGIQVAVESGHTLAAGHVLNDVIDAAGTLNASSFTVGDNSIALAFEASIDYDDNEKTVDLIVTETGFTTGVTAANAFIGSAPTSDLAFALGSMNTLKEVQDASDSLRPALSGGVAQMTNTTTNAVTDVIAARQDRTRGLSSGDGFMEDRHLWVKPFGNWTDQDDRDGVDGYDIDSYGVAFGIDGDVSPTWNLGIAFAYIDSEVDSNLSAGAQRIDVDSYVTKVYGTKTLDNATALNLQAGFGISDYDSKRRLFNGDVANADYDSWHFQASIELERSYQMNEKTALTPYVHADYGYVDVDSYREKGAGELNLDVNDDSADSLIVGTGVKTSYIASKSLLLTADAGIGYDFMTDRSSLTSSFAGGGAQFSSKGIDPDEVVYNAGLGAEFNLDNGSEITVRYEIDGREDYTDQSVSVNFRLLF
jgi:outer membrane autotransporter protein